MSLIRTIAAALCFAVLLACASTQPPAESAPPVPQPTVAPPSAGTLFVGTALAGPRQRPQPNFGIYVEEGVIRGFGQADEVRGRYPNARVVDVGSATIVPGLVDAHGHLYGLGLALDTVNLVDTKSYVEVVARTVERASAAPPGEWILGRGWDQNDWRTQEFPTADDLDVAIPDHPVWLRRIDGHAGLANSAAMAAAGITADTKDPEGGKILRDANGKPTGVFIDEAMELIDRKVPAPTFAQRKARVLKAAQTIAANGLTGLHDAGADDETIRAVRELIDEKRFPIRVYTMLGDNAALLQKWFAQGPLINYGNRLTVRSVKMYADGALGSRGAALLAPYADDPANSGLMIATPEHIADVSRRALAAGFQVNTHAIGDRGVRNVIDAYAAAGVKPVKRFRIEHLQVVAPDDFPRLKQYGIIASMQPTHATSDMYWAEARLGPERVKGAYAWRTVLESGARLALGSDFPVEQVNPWLGIHAAVTRQDTKGWPDEGWYPAQNLNLREAIRGFTQDAAYAAFEETARGAIEPGMAADFTIVDTNPYELELSQLDEVKVRMTVVGGEIVYEAK